MIVTDHPDSDKPAWSEPRRIGNGIMKNRPTVLGNGDWLLTLGLCRDNTLLPFITLNDEALAPYTREMISHSLGEERASNGTGRFVKNLDRRETPFKGVSRIAVTHPASGVIKLPRPSSTLQ